MVKNGPYKLFRKPVISENLKSERTQNGSPGTCMEVKSNRKRHITNIKSSIDLNFFIFIIHSALLNAEILNTTFYRPMKKTILFQSNFTPSRPRKRRKTYKKKRQFQYWFSDVRICAKNHYHFTTR